jgi:hypothetical protein
MNLDQVLEKIKEPDKLNDYREIDELIFWVDSWKTDAEEELHTIDYQVANKKLQLIEKHGSVAKGEAHLEVEDIYIKQQSVELRIKKLAAFKSNLRRRYEILTNQFR